MTNSEYSCKMCGNCCHFEIPMTLLDVHRIAKHLGEPDKKAFENYIQNRVSLHSSLFMIRKNIEGACVFLTEDKRCGIHQAKPKACRFYVCRPDSSRKDLPWTAACGNPGSRAELWEQSVAAMMTKAYIKENGAAWNDADYYKAILGIYDNVVISASQRIKLAKDKEGAPLAMIYDCTQCDKRGTCAGETPVTLDDIRNIGKCLGLSWETLFRDKIADKPSVSTGGLKLARNGHCVFFHPESHCTIKEVRPMHCRFTPCPQHTKNSEIMDCLYLGSGTVEEQFRHQVGMALTRQYVGECGVAFNEQVAKRFLEAIDNLASDLSEVERFCKKISPYRYVDDTLAISKKISSQGLSTH
jgi:Fe-S-cluster containining protein